MTQLSHESQLFGAHDLYLVRRRRSVSLAVGCTAESIDFAVLPTETKRTLLSSTLKGLWPLGMGICHGQSVPKMPFIPLEPVSFQQGAQLVLERHLLVMFFLAFDIPFDLRQV